MVVVLVLYEEFFDYVVVDGVYVGVAVVSVVDLVAVVYGSFVVVVVDV